MHGEDAAGRKFQPQSRRQDPDVSGGGGAGAGDKEEAVLALRRAFSHHVGVRGAQLSHMRRMRAEERGKGDGMLGEDHGLLRKVRRYVQRGEAR